MFNEEEQTKKVAAYIQHIESIDYPDIKALVAHSQLKKFKKGEHFLREGDICRQVLFVYQGTFRYYLTKDGDDFTKDFCLDSTNPFCTGFSSFVMQTPSLVNIEALEDSLCAVWSAKYIKKLFATMPWLAFARKIAELLYIRKEKREISFLRDSAELRYRIFTTDFKEALLKVPQYHIASYLGITPESLSRIRRSIAGRS